MREQVLESLAGAPRLVEWPCGGRQVFLEPAALPAAMCRLKADGLLLEDVTVAEYAEGCEAVYHLSNPQTLDRVTLHALAATNGGGAAVFPTVSHIFQGADWHEREAMDFFPVTFTGHPTPLPLLLAPEMVDEKPLSRPEDKRSSIFTVMDYSAVVGAPSAAPLIGWEDEIPAPPPVHAIFSEGLPDAPGDFYTRHFQATGEPDRLILNMGPQHPSTHGVLRVILELDGEYIVRAEPVLGYIHRMHELMGQNRKAGQFLPNMGRVDYLHALGWNHALVLAVEQLAGIEVPERAELLRILTVELNRISSHLLWWGAYLLDLGAFTPIMYGFDDRETIMDLLQLATGSRLTYCYHRFGGVSHEPMPGFYEGVKDFIDGFDARLAMYKDLVTENIILRKRVEGVGEMDLDVCRRYGCTGPVIRGSGLAFDVRRAWPYSLYSEFDFTIPVRTEGDALARYLVRMDEMVESARIIRQVLERIPGAAGGHLHPKAPKQDFTLPKGVARGVVEAARGLVAVEVISDGGKTPYRMRLRSPCFSNLSCFAEVSRGTLLADAVSTLGSLDLVIPEIDR